MCSTVVRSEMETCMKERLLVDSKEVNGMTDRNEDMNERHL